MKEIDLYRAQIDKIDNELIEFLNKRMELVKAIGKLKQTDGTSIYRPEREQEILDRLKGLNKGPLNDDAIEAIFFEIFAVSRNLEMPEKIAYLGPKGSYTHQVAQSRFGSMGNYLSLSCVEAVFKVLNNKEAKYGVVPIENNTEGAVGETLDSLGKYDGIKIVAEVYMDIHHSFASKAEKIEQIKKIYSHPQGYNQCRKFLEEHQMLDIEFIPTKSTAQAAQKASKDPQSAAICSHIGAKMYNVPILFGRIEDNLANRTRFLILSDFKNAPGVQNKTSILARTEDKPGGLVELLKSFEDANVNLTKIESRPAKERGFKTVFYLEFEGHIDDKNVQKILKMGERYQIKWLGSYVRGESV
ncbi:MAG: prephenate dehydratase [Sulfurospirillaceae bacterium]|nr:prephenate dehydratase [Sulfurospirillaceae bacterium]